jgi:hypothetical protein
VKQPNLRRHRWNTITPAKMIGETADGTLFIDPTKREARRSTAKRDEMETPK